ncbi:MAG TPA: response regulator [Gemmatimonadaceae bacterium]
MSHTILLCDDALFTRTILGTIVRNAGYTVVGEAETGTQAVEQYRKLRPDVVFMDLVMPDMSGLDATRAIREFDPKARILMCSAMGQQQLIQAAAELGAGTFIVKPFTPDRILAALSAAVA